MRICAETNGFEVGLPTYSELRSRLGGRIVSNYWYDEAIDESRAYFRPSYERLFGRGGALGMPLAASWMSTGPSIQHEGNVVALPADVDRTFTAYMERIGVLGEHRFLDFTSLPSLARDLRLPIYNVDDLPDAWDDVVTTPAWFHRFVNTKGNLNALSGSPAPYFTVDLRTTTEDDFLACNTPCVYVKLNNTENTGHGVIKCDSKEAYMETVARLRRESVRYNASNTIVVQPKVDGDNHSFQYLLNPEEPTKLHLITISDQLVGPDGVSYAGNNNPPMCPEMITPDLQYLMTDMASRIRALFPSVFGFVMCDYFQTADHRLLAFDPGLRPTGNTATVLAKMCVEERVGHPMHSSFFVAEARGTEESFSANSARIDGILGPEAAARDGHCILPWGYNQFQGRGLWIAVSKNKSDLQSLMADARIALKS